ncbi:MAG: NeuD/PglB/VioB family sugar acetyltransferase [bacterium]
MEKIVLIGAGGHCKSCIDVIEMQDKFEIYGIIDIKSKVGQKVLGYEIIGTDDNLPDIRRNIDHFLITLGQLETPDIRISIFKKLKKLNAKLPVIISPLAHFSKHASADEGTIIMHHAVVNAGSVIGKNCIINTKALVEHDAIISNNCHIATGAIINGSVKVGENSFIGSGAVTKQNISIAKETFLKANHLAK